MRSWRVALAARAQGAGGRPGQEDSSRCADASAMPDDEKLRRRVGRYRRRVVERSDGDAQLSGELRSWARAQLGERRRDGDAHRAQRRHRRRQGPGDDRPRPDDARRAGHRRVGVLQERPDEGPAVHAAHPPRRQAGHLAQRADDGEVPAGDEEVLLRSRRGTRPISISSASNIRPFVNDHETADLICSRPSPFCWRSPANALDCSTAATPVRRVREEHQRPPG